MLEALLKIVFKIFMFSVYDQTSQKQKIMDAFWATKFLYLATEKICLVATWRMYQKVEFGPCMKQIDSVLPCVCLVIDQR